jgi:hypothetical protein
VVTAGVVEELLSAATRSNACRADRQQRHRGIAFLGAFSLAHLPFWGATSALFTLVAGAALTGLYLRKRNLVVNMIAMRSRPWFNC